MAKNNITFFKSPKQLIGNNKGRISPFVKRDNIFTKIEFNNCLYFYAYSSTFFAKLYKWDGAQVTQLAAPNGLYSSPYANDLSGMAMCVYQNALYLLRNGYYGVDLVKIDTNDQITSIVSSTKLTSATEMIVYNNELYISASWLGVNKLYKYDGTTITQPLGANGTRGSSSISDDIKGLIVFNGALYFSAKDSGGYTKVYKWNGTTLTIPFTTTMVLNTDHIVDTFRAVVYNNSLHFVAKNNSSYQKLFKWDGTTLTELTAASIRSGTSDTLDSLTVYGSNLYFSAIESTGNYYKVFKWNGTAVSQAFTINSSFSDISPYSPFIVYNNSLFFYGFNGSQKIKLYKWNGTSVTLPFGTTGIIGVSYIDDISGINITKNTFFAFQNELYFDACVVNDANPLTRFLRYNEVSSKTLNPAGLTSAQDHIFKECVSNNGITYFAEKNDAGYQKLFSWNGKSTTTQPLGNGTAGVGKSDSINSMIIYKGDLYFSALDSSFNRYLYKWNGTSLTQPIGTNVKDVVNCIIYQDSLYFAASDANGLFRLYKWNGTTLTQITNGIFGSSTSDIEPYIGCEMYVYKNELYFVTTNPSGLSKMYKWNGVTISEAFNGAYPSGSSGTSDFNTSSAEFPRMIEFNGDLYFSANNSNGFIKTFKWNGTSLTQPFGSLGTSGSAATSDKTSAKRILFNNCIYFVSANSSGVYKVYSWDGLRLSQPLGTGGIQGSASVTDFTTNTLFNDTRTNWACTLGKFLYFGANVPSSSSIIVYTWDGTTLTTQLSTEIVNASSFYTINNKAFFLARPLGQAQDIITRLDSGVTPITNGLVQQNSDQTIIDSVYYNGSVYVSANNRKDTYTTFTKMFKIDGAQITQPFGANGICGNEFATDNINNLTVFSGNLYFTANNTSGAQKLFKWDGATLTQPLGANGIRGSSTLTDNISNLVLYNNALYFVATNSSGYAKVYKFDGTSAVINFETRPGNTDDPSNLVSYNGSLYMLAYTPTPVKKIHRYNASASTIGVIPTSSGISGNSSTNDSFISPCVHNNKLYFSSTPSTGGNYLYEWNGTTATQTTTSVTSPTLITSHNTDLYFSGLNASSVAKLYKWDGTTLTQPVGTNGTSGSSTITDNITKIISQRGKLYFIANSGTMYSNDTFYEYNGTTISPHSLAACYYLKNINNFLLLNTNGYIYLINT